jgi:hypothetical protein
LRGVPISPRRDITTLGANRIAIEAFGAYYVFGAGTGTPGSGWTEMVDAASGNVSIEVDAKAMAVAGAVGTGNRTFSGGFSPCYCRIATALVPA